MSDLDPRFQVKVLSCTPNPEETAWYGMHQCYHEGAVGDFAPDEPGKKLVKHLLSGDRGHYSPLEHNSITFGVFGFPHVVMQQFRTHRVGISFSVQSTRYTGTRVIEYEAGHRSFEDVFYIRKPGEYRGRNGVYTIEENYHELLRLTVHASALAYSALVTERGWDTEAARYGIPYGVRQNFVMTVNARSLMHLLDMRHKPDAELESQELAHLLFLAFKDWMPNVAEWYENKRLNKGKLAP